MSTVVVSVVVSVVDKAKHSLGAERPQVGCSAAAGSDGDGGYAVCSALGATTAPTAAPTATQMTAPTAAQTAAQTVTPTATQMAAPTVAFPARRLSLLEHLAHAALERALASAVSDAVLAPCSGRSATNGAGGASAAPGAPVVPGPLLVDATAGNGHDSLFLLGAAPRNALLLAMDVQAQAVTATGDLLAAHGFAHAARVLHTGHEHLANVLAALAPEDRQRPLMCVVFNLGWLPGGNKGLVTTPATSLPALEAALEALAPGGCISLHCYTGHEGGAQEAAALEARVRSLPPRRWRVLALADANRERAAESLLLVERLPVKKRG